ncbi:FimV/HubP family polar landmark protein [Alkalisalibacterium limincola]|nr:FimV/HubP family polar landmark protein [Alkalisalibacterium limincola]
MGTKLELARAYIDIGDVDGARGMLEEVCQEGTEAQQAQARELLDGLR